MIEYKVEFRRLFTFALGGIALDSVINECVERGWKLEDVHITIEAMK